VAQTKRRRQTKHRGNAAGVVVARGRTGRKPTAAERSEEGRRTARSRKERADHFAKPPTWRGAFARALVAALVVLAASLLLLHAKPGQAVALFPVVLLAYIPMSYYTDLWLHRRRMRRKRERGTVGT
jgi:hypothetical protein